MIFRIAVLILIATLLTGCAMSPADRAERAVALAPAATRAEFTLAQAWTFERALMDGAEPAAVLEHYIAPQRHLFPYDLPPPDQRGLFDPRPVSYHCQGEGPGCMAASSGMDRNIQARTGYFPSYKLGGTQSRGASFGGLQGRPHITPEAHARAMNGYPKNLAYEEWNRSQARAAYRFLDPDPQPVLFCEDLDDRYSQRECDMWLGLIGPIPSESTRAQ